LREELKVEGRGEMTEKQEEVNMPSTSK